MQKRGGIPRGGIFWRGIGLGVVLGLALSGCNDQPPPKLPGDSWPSTPSAPNSGGRKSPSSPILGGDQVQRFCELIALNPDRVDEFRSLHQKIPQAVRDAIRQKSIRNYSVFICNTREQIYAIRYYEYVGEAHAADIAELERHPEYKAWRNAWEECQVTLMPLSSGDWWARSTEICHLP